MPEPGTELAGYRIERLVARGGMGEVYEATQRSLERRVALKLISEQLGLDESFRARFRREARLAASIDHPNILPVYEAGELPDGRLFLAMRFVQGLDLSDLLKERGVLDSHEAVAILSQIGLALDAAHDRGLIHRDVKPANVMLEQVHTDWRAYLTDFGLAKPHREDVSEHTAAGVVLGTIDYMAPEQITGQAMDGRADVYSFGCMLYQCLTGEVPYRRDTPTATLIAHTNAPVPVPSAANPAVPRVLDLVVRRAMEKDPEKRVHSAGALMGWAIEQLQDEATTKPAVTAESPTAGTLVTPAPKPAMPPDRPRWRPSLATTLHIVIYALLWTGAYLVGRMV
jgi:serine/threonine protein kinase